MTNRTDYFRAVFLFGGIMIAVLKSGVSQEQINNLIEWFKEQGLKVHLSEGDYKTILGLIGDTTKIDIDLLKGNVKVLLQGKEESAPIVCARREVKVLSKPHKGKNESAESEE